MKYPSEQIIFKHYTLWWMYQAFIKRHDGDIFDLFDGKYPTFTMTRREQVRFWIRAYRQSKH